MDSASPNWAAFKEPKAFIKLLQIILAILAFALTSGFASSSLFTAKCNNTLSNVEIKYNYPFNIDEINSKLPICGKTDNLVFGHYSSQSQFYVFVGVIAMLYCLGAIILYVFYSDAAYQDDRIPKIDFIITLVVAILWFIASVAWADGVSKLKQYTSVNFIINDIVYCKTPNVCTMVKEGTYGSLNASLIAGFSNVALWAANLWFLFKETIWYERRNPGEPIIGSESIDGGNM